MTPNREEIAREAKADLIDAIIQAYHTTRLRDTPASSHILSKQQVQKAFAAILALGSADGEAVKALDRFSELFANALKQPGEEQHLWLFSDEGIEAWSKLKDARAALTPKPAEPAPRYLSDHFKWAAPGDQQEDAWLVRFCDNDVRDMFFTGPYAEKDAWEAWERHSPGYNIYVFRLATLKPTSAVEALRAALIDALDERLIRLCFDHFMHIAEYPCSASAMRSAIIMALNSEQISAALTPADAGSGETK